MQLSSADPILILEILLKHNADFIVVGGVCGALHNAPVTTFDLDVVHSRDAENLPRLLAALKELDARYRDLGGRIIRPTESHLRSPGHQLLMTKHGPLDVLGEIGRHHDYQALLPDTVTAVVSRNLKVRTLSLEALIREKEAAGRDKDKAALLILRQTLKEKRR
jgi:hypothetical protein